MRPATCKIAILHWRDIFNPESGGAENLLFKIAQQLVSEGFQVTWFSPRFRGSQLVNEVDGVIIRRIGGKYSAYLLAPLLYLTKWHKDFNLFVDSITGVPWFTPLYIRQPRLALVYHLGRKETFFADFRHRLGALGYFFAVLALFSESSIPFLYRNTDIITFSEDTREELSDIGLNPRRIFVAQEGIELERYTPNFTKPLQPTIVYVGRFVSTKGIEHLLQAVKGIVRRIPNVRLVIIGRGYLERQLRELCERLGIDRNVEFAGYVTEEQKIAILRSAHVLVIPSLREGWATPVIEANACGTPAVGTDVRGVRNTIINGVTGFLVPYGNPERLAQRILCILTDPEKASKMAQAGQQLAKQYNIRITIALTLNIFKRKIYELKVEHEQIS